MDCPYSRWLQNHERLYTLPVQSNPPSKILMGVMIFLFIDLTLEFNYVWILVILGTSQFLPFNILMTDCLLDAPQIVY